ncbi:MAG: hypothetical protein LBV19_03340 [Streptococcaceae bacterium]|jgi:cytoskeletal protein RodZ|nr:hypothetical protein [Streptococcaceae bacterium]
MAKQQRKEPWNSRVNNVKDEAFDTGESRASRNNRSAQKGGAKGSGKDGTASTVFLSVLVFFMFAIIGGAIFFTIWNNRNPNMKTVESNFYPAAGKSASSSSTAVNSASSSSAEETSGSSTEASSPAGNTYTYTDEVTVAEIEQNAGVSWATLAKYNPQLNPDWGNGSGYPLKDGSYLTSGTVLKTSK